MRVASKKNAVINVTQKPVAIRNCNIRVERDMRRRANTPNIKEDSIIQQQKTQPQRKLNTISGGNWRANTVQTPQVIEEKKFRGPLKKRPISSTISQISPTSNAAHSLTTNTTRRSNASEISTRNINKAPATKTSQLLNTDDDITEYHPTIAAGRSRRAIKPNPKYTSEDIVTPRTIKQGANTSGSTVSSLKRESTSNKRTHSESSSTNFFSRESSVGLEDTTEYDDIVDKTFIDSDKELNLNLDHNNDNDDDDDNNNTNNDDDDEHDDDDAHISGIKNIVDEDEDDEEEEEEEIRITRKTATTRPANTSTLSTSRLIQNTTITDSPNSTGKRPRGRPRREPLFVNDNKLTPTSNTIKSTPSLITTNEQTTRKINDSNLAQKRKFLNNNNKNDDNDDDNNYIKRKRYVISTKEQKYKSNNIEGLNKSVVNGGSNRTYAKKLINNIDIADIAESSELDELDESPYKTQNIRKDLGKIKILPKTLTTTTTIPAKSTTTTINLKQSSSTIAPKAKVNTITTTEGGRGATTGAIIGNSPNNEKSIIDKDNEIVNIDGDVMPTFTIVNINDIISKKGDVLISKTSNITGSSDTTTTTTAAAAGTTSATTSTITIGSKTSNDQINIRKTVNNQDKGQQSYTKRIITKKNTPTILNHQLASRSTARNLTETPKQIERKPAPRILNSMVAKKTQPVKPLTANPDDSADEGFTLSLDDDDDDDNNNNDTEDDNNNLFNNDKNDDDVDDDDDDVMNNSNSIDNDIEKSLRELISPKRKTNKIPINPNLTKVNPNTTNLPSTSRQNIINNNNKNSPLSSSSAIRRSMPGEKTEVIKQGDKIIKKVTCLENWYVMNRKKQLPIIKPPRNTLEMPLIELANMAKNIQFPSAQWSSKVTLYELPSSLLAKSTLVTYTGDISEHNIDEKDREKYQPSCVMFRRVRSSLEKTKFVFDRALVFKNNTFFINIEGKTVCLIAAPTVVNSIEDVEILLDIINYLSLGSQFLEISSTM